MSSKPDLIAIYRLEFYKKQKNWKLKKKDSKKHFEKESTLNKTYDVDTQAKEQLDVHNVAFIETDTDKNTHSFVNKHRLSLEKLEAVNIWPESGNLNNKSIDVMEKPKENCTRNRLLQLQMAASMEHSEDHNYESTEFKSWSEQALEWNYEGSVEPDYVISNVWNQDVIDSPSSNNLLPGLLDNAPWTTSMDDEWCDWSVDSIGEFYRGADAAPHSSEYELTLPPCVSTSDVSFSCLSRLSSRQLAGALALHARVLRRLRRERTERERLRSLSYNNLTSEDVPTRDIDGQTHVLDRIIAGSHTQGREEGSGECGADLGRGRGRGRLIERDRYRLL